MPNAEFEVPRPVLLVLSSFALACVSALHLLQGDWQLALLLGGAAGLPWRRTDRGRLGGVLAAFAGLAGAATRYALGTQVANPWTLTGGAVVCVLRAWVLQREAVRRWAAVDPAVSAEEFVSLAEAISEALRASPEERREKIDRALVAIACERADAVPRDETVRRAMWINIYNVLAAHASRGRRSVAPDAVLEPFRTRYQVFGRWLSPNQIEHGLLRDNSPPPGWFVRPFREGDPRMAWRVALDPRIHFALNCASTSCPPIRVYDAARLNEQLEFAQSAFITAETRFDPARGRVTTSKILRWYAADFGGFAGVRTRLAATMNIPAMASASVFYAPYDWTNPEFAGGLSTVPSR